MSGAGTGTINQAPPGLQNPLLARTEQALEARLKPNARQDYLKIVVAGLHIALANGQNSYLAKLHASHDPIGDCGKGAAQLVIVMSKEAKGTFPMQSGIPAGVTLLLHGLDFIDHAGDVKIGEAELDRATAVFTNNLLHLLGITPQMLATATQKVHGIVADPGQMHKIGLRAGTLRDPNAAVTTPGMPEPGEPMATAPPVATP